MTLPAFAEHLLPNAASGLEKVLAAAAKRLSEVPAPIDLVKRPDETPFAFLASLNWEVSADLWDPAWEEWRKRKMARRSIALHRIKGTLRAVEGYLDILDAKVVEAVLPPQGCFALRGRTEEEKRAFLARFAQLRIHVFSLRVPGEVRAHYCARRKGWLGPGGAADPLRAGRRFLRPDVAPKHYGRQARIWDKGAGREVIWGAILETDAADPSIVTPLEQVTVPGEARPHQGFVGRLWVGCRRSFVEPLRTQSRLLTLTIARTPGITSLPVVRSGTGALEVLRLQAERVYDRGTGRKGTLFVGRIVRRHITANDAAIRIYDRFYLYDPARVPTSRRLGAGTFVGHSRISLTPFRAEFRVSYPRRGRRGALYVNRHLGEGHMNRPRGAIARVAQAIRAAKSHRDRILFTTQCHRPLAFGDAPPIDGTLKFGQQVRIAP